MGITLEGDCDVLGLWFQETEGAKFWMQVLTELKQRGVSDILICCVDGLKGFPEAIEAIFPRTTVQTCIVHLLRHSLKYVPGREREQVARDLKPIYTALDADAAQQELERFDEKWGARFPVITQAWLNAWEYAIPFLAFPEEVRREIHTTNAFEASTGSYAKRSRPRATSPTRTPPASSSTSPSPTPSPLGPGRATGPSRCPHSRSTSATACLTLKLTPTPRKPSTNTLKYTRPAAYTDFRTPSPLVVVALDGGRGGEARIQSCSSRLA